MLSSHFRNSCIWNISVKQWIVAMINSSIRSKQTKGREVFQWALLINLPTSQFLQFTFILVDIAITSTNWFHWLIRAIHGAFGSIHFVQTIRDRHFIHMTPAKNQFIICQQVLQNFCCKKRINSCLKVESFFAKLSFNKLYTQRPNKGFC